MRTLEEYQVSRQTGFLLERPCTSLPRAWLAYEQLADAIVPLLSQPDGAKASADFLAAVEALAEPADEAKGEAWAEADASLETRAYLHLCLTCLAAAYLWHRGESAAPNLLPVQLARPLHRVSERLGVRPAASHATLALANCSVPDGWSGLPEDLRLLKQPGPSPAFRPFLLITCAFELDFAPAVPLLIRCAGSGSESEVAQCLEELADRLTALATRFNEFGRLLEPDEFYRSVRPFLTGHDRLVFDGVAEAPVRLSGGSAAQSAILQSVDALMGIRHESDFLADMINYMHPAHRRLLADLASETRVPQLLSASAQPSAMRAAHARAVAALEAFRTRHIGLVSRYIVAPARRISTDFASLAERGTGGQPLIKFLKEVRDECRGPAAGDGKDN